MAKADVEIELAKSAGSSTEQNYCPSGYCGLGSGQTSVLRNGSFFCRRSHRLSSASKACVGRSCMRMCDLSSWPTSLSFLLIHSRKACYTGLKCDRMQEAQQPQLKRQGSGLPLAVKQVESPSDQSQRSASAAQTPSDTIAACFSPSAHSDAPVRGPSAPHCAPRPVL
jgi:hypothetical protein